MRSGKSLRAINGFPWDFLHSCGAHLEFGDEASELLVPVVERRGWRDDKEGTPNVVSLRERE